MVKINRTNNTYEVVLTGDESTYFDTLKALTHLIGSIDEQEFDKETIYYVAKLLEEMAESNILIEIVET